MMRHLSTFLIGLFLLSTSAFADSDSSIESFLRAFHADPYKEMDRLPYYVESDGSLVSRGYIDWEKVEERMEERLALRNAIAGDAEWNTIGIPENTETEKDLPERLVEGGILLRNLAELEGRGLNLAAASVTPWADSYWPMYKGIIANRYADPRFPDSKSWAVNYQYSRVNSASGIVAFGDTSGINQLSPAEKYDYVVGDRAFTLSQFSWNQGKKHYDQYGVVAGWMGICHGWAGASHMHAPIPESPITVIASSGRPVTFYPQDVKALQSMLWANASPSTRFVGNRCYVSRPEKDAYGRIMDAKCFDANPGTWHLAVTNQMGINDRSFVMDSTFDAEVWNFPLASYKYRYFNPETWKEGTTFRASMIPVEQYRVDKFKQYRSPHTKYVVGVFMDISHVGAINPSRRTAAEPLIKTVRFVYDLELDANLNIIGGEWYSNAHPDFLWTFDREAQAMSGSDRTILGEDWNPSKPVPSHWAALAQRASNRGAPLYSFVRWLSGSAPSPGETPNPEEGTPNDEIGGPGTPTTPVPNEEPETET